MKILLTVKLPPVSHPFDPCNFMTQMTLIVLLLLSKLLFIIKTKIK